MLLRVRFEHFLALAQGKKASLAIEGLLKLPLAVIVERVDISVDLELLSLCLSQLGGRGK